MTTSNGSRPAQRSMPPTWRRPRADCASTSPLPTVQEFLPKATTRSLHALDIGCGTGAIAVRLARLGFHVTLLDPSARCWIFRSMPCGKRGFQSSTTLKQGDAAQLANLFDAGSFDVILCHNVLEFVEIRIPCCATRLARCEIHPAIVSVLVRSQAGEVLKAALQAGDLVAAEKNLTAAWGQESLYGGRVRLFQPDGLQTMMRAASLATVAAAGCTHHCRLLAATGFSQRRVRADFRFGAPAGQPPRVCRGRPLHALSGTPRRVRSRRTMHEQRHSPVFTVRIST